MKNLFTPRFVSQFKVAGTRSFRLSSTKLLDWGSNGQNVNDCVLQILTSRKGHKFVQADQSGAEALVVANLAPRGRYIELFRNGIKPHTYLALHLFADSRPEWFTDISPKEMFLAAKEPAALRATAGWPVLKHRVETSGEPYDLGKRTIHAKSYKMGWHTFQENVLKMSGGKLVLSVAQAKKFLAMVDELFPELAAWQDEVIFIARRDRELRNLFGYPRRFERIFTQSYEREIISWIPQSTVGCLSTEAMLALEPHAESRGWTLLNQKHDSLLYEVPDADVAEAAILLPKTIASFELTGRGGEKFRMKSSVAVGENWGKWDANENPTGMKELK